MEKSDHTQGKSLLKKYSNLQTSINPGNKKSEETEDPKYYHIWKRELPSLKDITETDTYPQVISGLILFTFFFITLTFLTQNLVFSVGVSVLIVISFVVAFHTEIFRLQSLFRSNPFSLFKEGTFWHDIQDDSILYLTHSRDKTTVGMSFFQLETLAENVRPNLSHFIKALINTEEKIPFTYQIIKKQEGEASYRILLYYAVYHLVEGTLSETKLAELNQTLMKYRTIIQGAQMPNVHHVKFTLLKGIHLINAYRAVFLQISDIADITTDFIPRKYSNVSELFVKTGILLGLSIAISLLCRAYPIPELFHLLIGVGSFLGLSVIWNRSFFTLPLKSSVFHSPKIIPLDPFFDVQFYRFRRYPDTLFYHAADSVLGGIKMSNLHHILTPPYCKPDKFYEAITTSPIPYTVTYQLSPINWPYFEKYGLDKMRESERHIFLSYSIKKDKFLLYQWFQQQYGLWNTLFTLSTSYSLPCSALDSESVNMVETQLYRQHEQLKIAYDQNYYNYSLVDLKKIKLEYGLMFELLKQKRLRRGGTYLNYSIVQGRVAVNLIAIADIFKKGIETRIGAEFNTPLHLTDFITCGNTINTEILEEESPAGFTLEQLHSLLVTNGTQESRDFTIMRILVELLQKGYPSIIFDTIGSWSRLLTLFEHTQFAEKFLYFKMRRTLMINPLNSDIPYDKDNIRYLDFMFDAYALCYKKDERSMEHFKNTFVTRISDGQFTQDIQSLRIDYDTRKDYDHSTHIDTIIQFFDEFFPQDITLMDSSHKTLVGMIPSYEFLTTDKTVIIDLSEILNRESQCFYSMAILAKFIHYVHSEGRFLPKFIVLPNIDMIFEGIFLNRYHMYDRIHKFLQPLRSADFGIIASTSQLYHLHENVFDFFTNFIAFKTTDKRDFAVMSNLLGLDSIHGKGMYSSSRKESFQMKYMSEMRPDEAVMKRDDNYQPFPVRIHFQSLRNQDMMVWDQILDYMVNQGYNAEDTEQVLLARSKPTLFQKDFGKYISLTKQIINFLDSLKKTHMIGNTTSKMLKDQLFKFLYPQLVTITKSRARMNEIRNEVFAILIKQRYLVEAHPRRAGGGESMHTSYAVGPYYFQAVTDYYNTRKAQGVEVAISSSSEVIEPIELDTSRTNMQEVELNQEDTDSLSPAISTLNVPKIMDVLSANFGAIFFYELYHLQTHIDQGQYTSVIHRAKHLFPKFIYSTCKAYYGHSYHLSRNSILSFLNELALLENFPLTYLELTAFLEFCESISPEGKELKQYSHEVLTQYNSIFDNFYRFIGV
ncbi:MAG: hypothetical protein ACFFKA_04975 [Candidatus Thorarchaeota archaeon]